MTGERLLGALSLARRAGALVCGFDEVCRAAGKGTAQLVLLAQDTAAGTAKRARAACQGRCQVLQPAITQQDLAAVARKPVGVLAITEPNLAELCRKCCQQGAGTRPPDEEEPV